jgi:hypothetical protein
LRLAALVWVFIVGHKPVKVPGWVVPLRPAETEGSRPIESESPSDPSEASAAGELLFHGQRSERTLRGELARCKLPPNHLTSHFWHGRGFLMAESCYGSEHALRNGLGSHLRC